MAERRLQGLQRVLGVNALFSTAYGNVGSSIYYALGLVASFALGLTPLVFIITGVIFFFGYPEQYAYNDAFYFKAAFMGIAAFNILAFYGTSAFREVRTLGPNADVPGRIKLIAATSLSMWIAVLVCGRLLTFFRPPFFHSG